VIHEDNSLLCLPLTDDDLDQAAILYTNVFLNDEPTSHRHAPDPSMFLPYARYYISHLPERGFSYIIKEANTGDLVGFIFGFDLADDFWLVEDKMKTFLSHFREAIIMIEELENQYINSDDLLCGTFLHIFQIGVSSSYRGLEIAGTMINQVVRTAKEKGYTSVISDCTCKASKRAFEKCGFYEIGFSGYDKFSADGVKFFEGLEGGISLMMLDIR
jgi:ribosomal protein S18 acetylase RimI-like enzyme